MVPMNEQIIYFESNYHVVSDIHTSPEGDNIFIGDRDNRACRYCGKKTSEVTFKKIAHTVPEFIGNKKIISYDECDGCNTKFSRIIEDHFSKYLGAQRTIAQVRGKKGVPSYKSIKKKSRMDMDENGIIIKSYEDDLLCEIDEENHQLKILVNYQPYIPAAVFKCLAKIALSTLPVGKLKYFQETIKWILDETHDKNMFPYSPLMSLHTFVPGPHPHRGIKLLNLERKNDSLKVPYLIGIVAFANFIYQINVPSIEKDKHLFGSNIDISYFPTPFDVNNIYGDVKRTVLDLSSYERTENTTRPVTMRFDSIEKSR
ncbi:HNH endonuclease 5 domain-containing protein [Gammaproteobacteria bacterium]